MLGKRKFRTRQAQKRERRRFLFRIVLSVIAVASFLALIGYGLQWEGLRFSKLIVQNDGILTTEELTAVIQPILDDKHALLVPNDSLVWSGTAAVQKALETAFPRIKTVHIQRAGLSTLTTTVRERTPVALWCGDVVPSVAYNTTTVQQRAADEAWGTCYQVDENGFLYAKAPLYTGNIFIRYYGMLEESEPIGQNLVPKEEFSQWHNFLNALADDGRAPVALLFVDERDAELYLTNGLRVLMPRDEALEVIRNRLNATLDEQAVDLTRAVEYLDLRFGTKAFIRYAEDDAAQDEYTAEDSGEEQ